MVDPRCEVCLKPKASAKHNFMLPGHHRFVPHVRHRYMLMGVKKVRLLPAQYYVFNCKVCGDEYEIPRWLFWRNPIHINFPRLLNESEFQAAARTLDESFKSFGREFGKGWEKNEDLD